MCRKEAGVEEEYRLEEAGVGLFGEGVEEGEDPEEGGVSMLCFQAWHLSHARHGAGPWRDRPIGVPLAHGGGCAIGAGPWRDRPIGVPSCRTPCDRHRPLQHVNAGAQEAS